MIEFLILWQLSKSIGKIAYAKGRSVFGCKAMLWGMWIGCEILFLFVAIVMRADPGVAYLMGILGAIIGAFSAFAIAKSMNPVTKNPFIGGFPVMPADQLNQPYPQRNEL